jgi:hypothetical protein
VVTSRGHFEKFLVWFFSGLVMIEDEENGESDYDAEDEKTEDEIENLIK